MNSACRLVLLLAVLVCFTLCCAACALVPSPMTASSSINVASGSSTGESPASGGSGQDGHMSSAKAAPSDFQASQEPESHSSEKTASSSVPIAFENDPAYDDLRVGVEDLVSDAVMDVGVAFVDLTDADRIVGFSVNGDTSLVAASMIKLAVLAEFLDEVENGDIAMEEPYTLQAEDIVGGTGSVQSAGAGSTFTFEEFARLMICESDNVAANVLIDRMGMDAVNAQMKELGLDNTQLVRRMMDEAAMAQRKENLMSAEDAAILLARIYRGQLVSETASAFALEALEAQTDSAGLTRGLPEGVVFAHKTGTLAMVRNDGGIVEAEKPYVLVVFCSGAEQSAAYDLMDKISMLVYERFE